MSGEGATTVTIGTTRLVLLRGDITTQATDAIVNAANTELLGGGGVDGAIHRAGGPAILEECKQIRARQGGCPTGEAVITTGGRLPAKFVIHTVGPVWSGGGRREDELLASAYRASLRIAAGQRLRSIAFPSISTGAYRFPIERATAIALGTVRDFLSTEPHSLDEVRFVLFSEADLGAYQSALRQQASRSAGGTVDEGPGDGERRPRIVRDAGRESP
jgi:O-acetyl-ADP-ribose deacetylase